MKERKKGTVLLAGNNLSLFIKDKYILFIKAISANEKIRCFFGQEATKQF